MIDTGVVISQDGSKIGFERLGSGPPMLLVHGTTADRGRWAAVRDRLARDSTLYLLDRRGRGLSQAESAGEYNIELEADDIRAVLEAIGRPTFLVGHSYGGACCLEALPHENVARVVLYEPVLATPGHIPARPELVQELARLLSNGQREQLVETFMLKVAGATPDRIEWMRGTEIWQARIALAHTIFREVAAGNANLPRPDHLARISVPVRVLVGTESPAWLRSAALATHEGIPGSEVLELEGQSHFAMDEAPDLFVEALVRPSSPGSEWRLHSADSEVDPRQARQSLVKPVGPVSAQLPVSVDTTGPPQDEFK